MYHCRIVNATFYFARQEEESTVSLVLPSGYAVGRITTTTRRQRSDLYNRASSPIQGHPQGASLLPAELHPVSHPSPSPHAVGMTALLDYCFRGSFSHLSFNDIDRDRDGGRWPCLPPVWMDETLAVHDEGRCHRMHDQSVINTCLTGLSLSQKHRRKCSLHSRAPAITQIHGTL
ncbi:hypothetical protein K443DRAFT_12949 [Laccaria amethystina LaAM-08-1]|uniref:Uncharacterized protein n=1 Tax=Laccaria amethystina LaAM-08-1 TaxID=1095629 RepID=A0A0C9WQC4_9AGAR|nr:hypothetical protein K443DRAFT_12949 [Laccaria amethystina LaAM-08-1]